MENASKALIIAGAILISIVLITLGVVILQQGDSMTGTGETALNSREIESFNSQFKKYEGTSVSGTNARALINAITSNNAAQNNSGGGHLIVISDSGTNVKYKINDIEPGAKYEIKVEDKGSKFSTNEETGKVTVNGNTDGYVDTVTITKK